MSLPSNPAEIDGARPPRRLVLPESDRAGRFELIPVPHWAYPEMRAAFGWSVERYIYFGGYPGAAELIVDTTTLGDYLDLLAGAGMLTGLAKFSQQSVRQRASSPKLQVLNTALLTAQAPLTFAEDSALTPP